MARNWGRTKHSEDGGRQREGRGWNPRNVGPTLRSTGFGGGVPPEERSRCPRCKTTGHNRFIQVSDTAFLKEGEEKWVHELVCTKCRNEVCGKPPDKCRIVVITSPDVSGYQPGIARFPNDPGAYVSGKRELDRKLAGRKQAPDAQNASQ